MDIEESNHAKVEVDSDTYWQLIILILQFLEEEKFVESLHLLEQESKVYFNLEYFGEIIIKGEWEKAQNYFSAFTRTDDGLLSRNIFLKMQKQKCYEAMLRNDCSEAATILQKDLIINEEWDEAEKYLSAYTELDDQYQLQQIFKMQNGRHHEDFDGKSDYVSNFTTASSLRAGLLHGLNQLISKYPILQDKLKFLCMDKSRLLAIIKQTMDWWVPHCTKARENPDNRTFSLDNIPTVPYLCYDPSVLISSSSLEIGESFIPWTCGCRTPTCKLKFVPKIIEKFGLQVMENCTSQKATEMGSNSPTEQNCGVSIKSSTEITEINDASQCHILVLPDDSSVARIARLSYTKSGDFMLALAQNAMHKLWVLGDDKCSSGKAITDIQPCLHQPSNGLVMTNDVGENPENTIHCFALKDHNHLLSASGGRISIYNLQTFETENTFAVPPPVATYFIFLPQDIFVIGLDDSTILIYCSKKIKAKLQGHQKTTCLAFSHNLNVLVSSGADAQLSVWDAAGWEKLANKTLHSSHTGQVPDPPVVNYIEFHKDQIHLLTVNERQIDIYEAPMLNHCMQSVPLESDLPITHATYSCDGQSIFISFKNGCVKIVSSKTLEVRCRINLTAYAQPNPSLEVYPTVVAAHPFKPNQIALGLTDGRVIVLEPLASEEKWIKDGLISCS
ncbi:topless-related protein 4 [Senna tora]|uniref:Topless-related protein 4 n=1 Tax=Senna tora TaxID=362788 RepID=A0A834WPY2_9FABA|nr:topless-related protein 4 [Senna tora]